MTEIDYALASTVIYLSPEGTAQKITVNRCI